VGKNVLEKEQIDGLAQAFETKTAQQVLEFAVETFGKQVALACSFGAEDVVLVDMLVKIDANAQIFYLDTNKHFPETYETRDRLAGKYHVSFMRILPRLSLEEQAALHGDKLWETDPNLCCKIRKVDPLRETLTRYDAWITGIRREQAKTRAHAKKIEWDPIFGLVKFNPLADWTWRDVWSYIHKHNVPYNPLHDQNYPSIGCAVCTRPVKQGEDLRSGRWSGFDKTECGLHQPIMQTPTR
jgi:phosphoadenosine phosphosulfate reductase